MSAPLSHQHPHKDKDAPHLKPPHRFRCAVFPAAGAPLELVDVEYRPPAKGTVTIKVDACFLSQHDAIGALGLRAGHDHFPVSPGQCVVGRVVEAGSGAREGGQATASGMVASIIGKLNLGGGASSSSSGEGDTNGEGHPELLHHKFKAGDHVVASVTHQGLGEYCTAHGTSTVAVVEGMPLLEQAVVAVFGGRVLAVWERFKWDLERKSEEELSRLREACPAHAAAGKGCPGVVVVWGSGGHASLAYHVLRAEAPAHEHIVVVSPSRKHSHLDYGVPEGDFLQVGECNLDDALRKLGGVKLCVCVDQPESGSGFRDLLYATCPGAEVSLVSIKGHGHLEVPVGNLLGRSLVIRGVPALTAQTMHRALRLCHKRDLHRHVSVRKFPFERDAVRACYDETLKPTDSFGANCVVFEGEGQTPVPI